MRLRLSYIQNDAEFCFRIISACHMSTKSKKVTSYFKSIIMYFTTRRGLRFHASYLSERMRHITFSRDKELFISSIRQAIFRYQSSPNQYFTTKLLPEIYLITWNFKVLLILPKEQLGLYFLCIKYTLHRDVRSSLWACAF